jgi:hypothetical protein
MYQLMLSAVAEQRLREARDHAVARRRAQAVPRPQPVRTIRHQRLIRVPCPRSAS